MTEKKVRRATESEPSEPRPSLLDVVMIDGRWAQVGPFLHKVIFLDEKFKTGENISHPVNWDDYEAEIVDGYVKDIRESREMSEDEYNAIHYGPEQEKFPELRDKVTFFGRYEKKR